jgi:hypothetical protein
MGAGQEAVLLSVAAYSRWLWWSPLSPEAGVGSPITVGFRWPE